MLYVQCMVMLWSTCLSTLLLLYQSEAHINFYICLRVCPETFQLDVSFSPGRTLYRPYHQYYYMWSPTQKWKKWRRSTTLFFLRWALPRCSCPTPFADVWDIQHVPCLALFVVRVETLAFIRKYIYKSPVILYHAVYLLLDIGKNTSVRQHVGRRPSWSTCHARRTPRESHPGRRTAVTMANEPSNHRPTSHFEVARTKEPS